MKKKFVLFPILAMSLSLLTGCTADRLDGLDNVTNNLQEQIDDLKEKTDKLEKEISDLKTEMNNSITDVKVEYNSKIAVASEKINSLQEQINNLTTQLVADKASLEEDYNTKVNNLKTYLDGRVLELENTIEEDQAALTQLSQKHENDKEALQADYNEKIETLISSNAVAKEEIENDYNSKINALAQKHDADVEKLKDELNDGLSSASSSLASAKQELQSDYNNKLTVLEQKHNEDIQPLENDYNAKLDTLSNSDAEARQQLENSFNSSLAELEEQYNSDIETLEQELENAIGSIESSISTSKQELQSDYNNKLTVLEQKFENDKQALQSDYNSKIDTLAASELAARNALKAELEEEISALETAFNTATSNLENDIAACNQAINTFKTQYQNEKAALETDYNTKIANLQNAYNNKVLEINGEISSLSTQISELETEMDNAISEIENDYNAKINSAVGRIETLETVQYHTVTFNSNQGSFVESQSVKHGEKATKPQNPTRPGYTFTGWTYQNEPWVFYGYVITEDITLNATWVIVDYTITLNPNSGSVFETSIDIHYGQNYVLPTPTRLGYTFAGWYDNTTPVAQSGTWQYTSSKTFVAHWTAINYQINYALNGGKNNSLNPSYYTIEDIIQLQNPSKAFYTFDGWFDGNNNHVTSIELGTTGDISLEARWSQTTQQMEDEVNAAKNGVLPVLSNDGKTITYGLYPQTIVNDTSIIAALNEITTPESNGWYLYNGNYYAKRIASQLKPGGVWFSNGTYITEGEAYWFKCELITWNVLSNNNGDYYLLSSVLLDVHRYNEDYESLKDGHYANNYKFSEIREWLNNDFYNSAFTLGDDYILATNVDNSALTTADNPNQYICDDTLDKVFLPSYQDYLNNSYGFSTNTDSTDTRGCITTDWARAAGASSSSSEYGWYFTRSPSNEMCYDVWAINRHGTIYADNVNYNDCVRPAITLNLDGNV